MVYFQCGENSGVIADSYLQIPTPLKVTVLENFVVVSSLTETSTNRMSVLRYNCNETDPGKDPEMFLLRKNVATTSSRSIAGSKGNNLVTFDKISYRI
jgi:hypothetical protein